MDRNQIRASLDFIKTTSRKWFIANVETHDLEQTGTLEQNANKF